MKTTFVLAALLLGAGPAVAAAQEHAGHDQMTPTTQQQAPAKDSFDAYDLNKDGKLSKAELAKHPLAAHAAMVDANRDGALDRKEFAALQKMM